MERLLVLAAESSEKMLKSFAKMEKSGSASENELDFYCTVIANKLYDEGKQLEKVLYFGKRGLKYMLSDFGQASATKIPCFDISSGVFDSSSINSSYCHRGVDVMIPDTLIMLGSVCFDLKRYRESLSYYNWASRNLTQLAEKEESCPGQCFLKKLESVNVGLFGVKRAMGKNGEASTHRMKILELKEKRLEAGCVELGKANKDVYEAYFVAMEFEGALPFCLKALEIYTNHFGCESAEVAEVRSRLGTIYAHLKEYEKAHEQRQLAKGVLKKVAPNSSLLLTTEIGDGHALIELGRHEEAFDVFRAVTSHTEASGFERAGALGGMASASLSLGKFADAKKFMRLAQRIYEKEVMDPLYAAIGFEDMSEMYEKMNDLEPSISLVRRVVSIPKLPQKLLLQATGRLFSLYSLAGKEKEGIPYMEDAVEKMKESFGLEHQEVGYCYGKLGQVYMNSVQEELAVKVLEKAKKIMDVSLGPGHADSLLTSHFLSVTYSRLRRLERAIEIEENVIEGLKGLGPRGQELMPVAVEHLNKLKEFIAVPHFDKVNSIVDLLGLKFGFGT